MLAVPGMTITAPKDGEEMIALLRLAMEHPGGPFAIRWPRDTVPAPVRPVAEIPATPYGTWETLRQGRKLAILATGSMVLPSLAAAEALAAEGIPATVVNARFIKPLDEEALARLFPAHSHVLTVEEGTVANGFGVFARARIGEAWPEVRGASMGLPDAFVEHGERAELLAEVGLTAEGIAERARALLGEPKRKPLLESA
jgi:1-deoxy-D-xylulose-5-phosphate synthase